MQKQNRVRRWQLTENNPVFSKRDCVSAMQGIAKMQYAICGEEYGEEQGTRHIHCFVIFKNAVRLSSLKSVFPRAHFEQCEGSNADNVAYVRKQDCEPVEVGELPAEREKRASASEIALCLYQAIDNGCPVGGLFEMYPEYSDYILRHFRDLQNISEYKYRNDLMEHRRRR